MLPIYKRNNVYYEYTILDHLKLRRVGGKRYERNTTILKQEVICNIVHAYVYESLDILSLYDDDDDDDDENDDDDDDDDDAHFFSFNKRQ